MEIWGYLIAAAYGALCLALSFIAFKLGMPKKYTRKLVHITVGAEWLILYVFHGPSWHALAVCLAFTALLVLSYFKKLMPMIASDSDNSPGTVYYGAAMSALALVCVFVPKMMLPFGVAVLCTSFGDGFAGVVGQLFTKYNVKLIASKTLFGALTNLLVSFFGSWIFSVIFTLEITVLDCLYIAIFSTVLELVTPLGLDNLAVPLGVGALTYLLAFVPIIDGYLAPILATPIIIAIALERRVLTPLGVAAAIILDVAVSIALGNAGFAILISFLLISVITDKIKKHKLGEIESIRRGKRVRAVSKPRNEIQVLANGGAALVCAVAYIIFPRPVFIIAFVAVMAEALADTVSSGLGVFAYETYDIFRWKKCDMGVSGGVSVIGSLAAVIASALIPTLAYLCGIIAPIYIPICAGTALLGCLVDTLIGSLLQEKYICKKCGTVTDEKVHCKLETVKKSGLSVVDNNVTNFVSNVFCAVVVMIVDIL